MKQGIKAEDIRAFEDAVNKLNDVMDHIRSYKPKAMAFLDNGDLFQLISDSEAYDIAVEHDLYAKAQKYVVTDVSLVDENGLGFSCGAIK